VEARFWPWREEPVAAGAVETPLPKTARPGPPGVIPAAPREGRVHIAEIATTVEEEEAEVAATPGVVAGGGIKVRPILTTVVTVEVPVKIFPGD